MEEEKKQIKIKRARSGFDQAPKEDPVPFAVCPHQECGCAATGCVVPKQECILKGKPVDMKEIFNEVPPHKNEDPLDAIHRKNESEWSKLLREPLNKVEFGGVIEQGEFVNEKTVRLRVVAEDGLTYADVVHYSKQEIAASTLASMLGEKAAFMIHKSDIKWNKVHRVWSPITGQVFMDFLMWLEFLPEQDQRDLIESRVSVTQFVEKLKKEFFV